MNKTTTRKKKSSLFQNKKEIIFQINEMFLTCLEYSKVTRIIHN